MASDILDRVGMVITTTGTGPVIANVLISNRFNTPAEAGAVNGASYWWMLEEDNDYQIFEGVWTASGTSIARTTTWISKIGGVKGTANMNLGGNATLRSITPAEAFLGIVRFDRDQVLSQAEHTRAKKNLKVGRSDNTSGDLNTILDPGFHDGVFSNSPDGNNVNYAYLLNQTHSNDPGGVNAYLSQELLTGLDGAVEPRLFRRVIRNGVPSRFKELGVTPIVLPKTANYSVGMADIGRVISGSIAQGGTLTLGALTAAAAGNGFYFLVENTSFGAMVFDPTGSETIDGRPTLNIFKGQPPFFIISDGTNWKSAGRAVVWPIASALAVNAVAAIDFTIPDNLPKMDLDLLCVYPAASGAALLIRSSTDGINFDANGGDYVASTILNSGVTTLSTEGSTGKSSITITGPMLNQPGGSAAMGNVRINSSSTLMARSEISHYNPLGYQGIALGAGYRNGGAAMKALRLVADSGAISAVGVTLFGIDR